MFEKLVNAFSSQETLLHQLLTPQALLWKALKPKTSEPLPLLEEALSKGANPNHPNLRGLTPLIAGVRSTSHYRNEMVERLLKAGANAGVLYKGRSTLSYLLEASFQYSSKPLRETFKLLLEHGADPKVGGKKGNALSEALYITSNGGRNDVVQLRMRIHSSALEENQGRKKATEKFYLPLVSSVSWDPKMISELIDLGVDPLSTPLFYQAIKWGDKPMWQDSSTLLRKPLQETYSKGLMALALMSAERYEYRADIERAFEHCPDLFSNTTLAYWMIEARRLEAFRVALTWMDVTEEVYETLQTHIANQKTDLEDMPKFLAYLDQVKLQNQIQAVSNPIQKPSARLL